MTHKDYELLAGTFIAAFNENEDGVPEIDAGIILAMNQVTKGLQSDNPRFVRSRFFQTVRKGVFPDGRGRDPFAVEVVS